MKVNTAFPPVITIDGPSGSGKGTLSHLLANHLGWHILDSGAIYRVLALAGQRQQISPENIDDLLRLSQTIQIAFDLDNALQVHSLLEGEDVSVEIRRPEIAQLASKISAFASIRSALLEKQRDCRQAPGLVCDGRDMGTVVFPDAALKIFLEASLEKRAERRYQQLKEKGISVKMPELIEELAQRDARDTDRAVAPLTVAADGILIDSSAMTVAEVFAKVLSLAEQRGLC